MQAVARSEWNVQWQEGGRDEELEKAAEELRRQKYSQVAFNERR